MAAIDDFASYTVGLDSPYVHAAAVTPSDSVTLTDVSRAIYVGVTGDVTLITVSGETVLFKAVPAGAVLRIRASQVKSTGTTATTMLALW